MEVPYHPLGQNVQQNDEMKLIMFYATKLLDKLEQQYTHTKNNTHVAKTNTYPSRHNSNITINEGIQITSEEKYLDDHADNPEYQQKNIFQLPKKPYDLKRVGKITKQKTNLSPSFSSGKQFVRARQTAKINNFNHQPKKSKMLQKTTYSQQNNRYFKFQRGSIGDFQRRLQKDLLKRRQKYAGRTLQKLEISYKNQNKKLRNKSKKRSLSCFHIRSKQKQLIQLRKLRTIQDQKQLLMSGISANLQVKLSSKITKNILTPDVQIQNL